MHQNRTGRLDWVDTAKGLSILLVVMMHSAYGVGEATGDIGVLHWIIAWATPFRMPEFFLIAGLFLSLVIARDWSKFADRRVVHYLYFYVLWTVLQVAFKFALGAYGAGEAAGYIVFALVEPYGVLWFVYMLAVFSALTKLLHGAKVPHWAVLAAGATLQIAPIATGIHVLDNFAAFFVFFYAGYALSPFIIATANRAGDHVGLALIGLAAWAGVHTALVFSPGFFVAPTEAGTGLAALPGIHLILALAGSLAVCVLASLLSLLKPMDWLRALGARSLVVYLAFVPPMAVTREVLVRVGIIENTSILSMIVMASAVICPLILFAIVERTGWGRFLFSRPDWAHLPSMRPQPRPAPAE